LRPSRDSIKFTRVCSENTARRAERAGRHVPAHRVGDLRIGQHGLPVGASAHATSIDQILVIVHWLMLVMFAGWSVYLVYVLVRLRRGANPKASYEGATGRWARLADW